MTASSGDWTGNWVFNAVAARVHRAGPRPVSEDHKPGLVSPDVDWLINQLAKINTKGRADSLVVQHASTLIFKLTALRARELGPVNLVGDVKRGFTEVRRTTKSDGPAGDLKRLERAALSGSPTRWIKAWSATPLDVLRQVWKPQWGPPIRTRNGFTRAPPKDLGIQGAIIGPKAEAALPAIQRALQDIAAKLRGGNKPNEEAIALADAIRSAVLIFQAGAQLPITGSPSGTRASSPTSLRPSMSVSVPR